MKKKALILASFLILLVLYGCNLGNRVTGNVVANTEPTLKIGVLIPLTGDAASYGENVKNGIDLANKELGYTLVYEDGKCNGPDAVNAIRKLIEVDKVDAIIGELCSGATIPAAAIAKDANVLMISPASTSPDLSNAGEHFFRTVPSDALQGAEGAKLVKDLGYQNLAILYVNDDYGVGFEKVLRENFNNVVISESFEKEATDIRTQLTKIKEKSPDAIYIISNSPAAAGAALKQIKELGITAQSIGSEGLKDNSVLDAAEGAGEGLILTFLAPSDTVIGKQFKNKYKTAYEEDPPIFAAEAYDAMIAISNALFNSDGSREGLITAMEEIKFPGASGRIDFDENGDVIKPYSVLKVVNGEFVEFKQ